MSEYDLTKFDKVVSDIVEIQKRGNFLPDCSTNEGYEASKRFVLDYTKKAKKALTDAHKEVKKPFWDKCKFLDGKKNELMPILEQVESPHKLAYKAKDQEKKEEEAQFDAMIQGKIQLLIDFRSQTVGKSSEEITDMIQACGETDTEEGFYNRAGDAAKERTETLRVLEQALMIAVQSEAMEKQKRELEIKEKNNSWDLAISMDVAFDRDVADEAARLAQEKIDNGIRIAKEAEIKATELANQIAQKAIDDAQEAKQQAIDEKAQADRDLIESQARQKLLEEQAAQEKINNEWLAIEQDAHNINDRIDFNIEKKRLAAIADKIRLAAIETAKQTEINRQKTEQDRLAYEKRKLEANKRHVGRVRCKIKEHIMKSCNVDEAMAKSIVMALLDIKARVTINY